MIIVAMIYGLITVMAFFENILVLLVILVNGKFHHMRYFLLASLALSDFLIATLIISNRTVVVGLEKWVFGTTWCYGSGYLVRVLHISTVLHLCAVSYERYNAIVRNPLNYSGRITKKRVILNITLLWLAPVVISLGPLIGWGGFTYNPEVFICEQKWDSQPTLIFLFATFVVPLAEIFILNYKVLRVVHQLQNGAKIIPLQLISEGKTQYSYQDQQQCQENELDAELKQKRNQEQDKNGEDQNQMKIPQNATEYVTLKLNNSSEMRRQTNSPCQEEPNQIDKTSLKNKTVLQIKKRNVILPKSGSGAPSIECNKRFGDKKNYQKGCTLQTQQPFDEIKTNNTLEVCKCCAESEDFTSQSQVTELPNHAEKQRRPLGKTHMRLAKLLREGKPARDVMIITGCFVLCYLPTWIMGCFRAFGGEPSPKDILSTHCFYATTVVWNPIIYSIRKRRFRKAVKKLLKL